MTPAILQFIQVAVLYIGSNILPPIVVGFAVGLAILLVGNKSENKKLKSDAIRELMTHRGDHNSPEFRKALNKISIIFHDKKDILSDVRQLYEAINEPSNKSEKLKRKIVGLIYKLCQKNGFKGLSEYDIDQAFPESKQTPIADTAEEVVNEVGKA